MVVLFLRWLIDKFTDYSYYINLWFCYPGSDLAGETAAAMAAVSLVFQDYDPDYSSLCLKHAKELYNFADKYRGFYHEAIKGAAQYYEYVFIFMI